MLEQVALEWQSSRPKRHSSTSGHDAYAHPLSFISRSRIIDEFSADALSTGSTKFWQLSGNKANKHSIQLSYSDLVPED